MPIKGEENKILSNSSSEATLAYASTKAMTKRITFLTTPRD